MYSITENLKNILKQPSRVIDIRVSVGEAIIGPSNITSFSMSHSLTETGGYSIGSATSKTCQLTIIRGEGIPEVFDSFSVEIGVCNQPGVTDPDKAVTYDWIPMGTFYSDDKNVSIEKLAMNINAWDKMSTFDDVEYTSNLVYPTTIGAVCTELGIINSTYPNITVKEAFTGSKRGVLKSIALLCGKNAIITRSEEIELISTVSTGFSIDGNNYETFKLNSKNIQKISKITTTVYDDEGEETELYVGDDTGARIDIEPGIIEDLTNLNLVYTASGLPRTYQGYECSMQGFPHLDVGDYISVETVDGYTYNIIVINHNFTFNGGMRSECSAEAIEEVNSVSSNNSATEAIKNISKGINRWTGEIEKGMSEKMSIVDYCSSNDTTKIDGSNLYTGTVSADKLNVRGLSVVNGDNITTLKIDQNGNVEMLGEINAESGTIGGFTIGEDSIYSNFEVSDSIWSMILHPSELSFMNSDEAKSVVYRQNGIVGDDIVIENRKGTMYLLSEDAQIGVNNLLITSNTTFVEGKTFKFKTLTSSQVTITSGSAYTFEIPIGVSNINVIGIPQLYIENGTGGNGESWINIYKTRTTASTVNVTVRNTYTGSCKVRCVCEIAYITIA